MEAIKLVDDMKSLKKVIQWKMRVNLRFNKALRSIGYKAKNMDNFYFFEDTIEESEMCFVLVDKGEKLIIVTPLNIWSEEENYGAILFEKVELKE